MKAAVVDEFGSPLLVEDVPRPDPGPGAGAGGGSRAVPHENETLIPIFQTVLNGLSLRGSIVGARQDLTEVFQLHRLGRTPVLRDHRPLERVNEVFTEALQGSATTRRIVFAI